MPRRILLIDEEELSRNVIRDCLLNTGHELSFTSNYDEAAESSAFDIVILDLHWPQLEGLKLISRILELHPATAIIAVSEFADRELEQEAYRNGAFACLTKPLQAGELLPLLESAASALAVDLDKAKNNMLPGKQIEQILLHGFSPDQQWDFKMIGCVRSYHNGDAIPLDEESGSLVWVERGTVHVYYNNALVERLEQGDFWGEETFVNPGAPYTQLIAQGEVQLRHFRRRRIMDFLTYQDETLTKHYMINLIHCTCQKLKRAIVRLGTCQEQLKD